MPHPAQRGRRPRRSGRAVTGPVYTRTRHHIGRLDPGDCWFPGPDLLPHTVTGVHSRDGRIVLTDQYGSSYSHPGDVVVSTAVPDPRILTPAAAAAARRV